MVGRLKSLPTLAQCAVHSNAADSMPSATRRAQAIRIFSPLFGRFYAQAERSRALVSLPADHTLQWLSGTGDKPWSPARTHGLPRQPKASAPAGRRPPGTPARHPGKHHNPSQAPSDTRSTADPERSARNVHGVARQHPASPSPPRSSSSPWEQLVGPHGPEYITRAGRFRRLRAGIAPALVPVPHPSPARAR